MKSHVVVVLALVTLAAGCEPEAAAEGEGEEGEGEACGPDDDKDRDGVDCPDDCDDDDDELRDREDDNDCDGADAFDDCDDDDARLGSEFDDEDCDGVEFFDDCDDFNPALGSNEGDEDCDGVVRGADCDDDNFFLGDRDNDEDCDQVLTSDDCDDTDRTSFTRFDDADCDDVEDFFDCDPNDPLVTRSIENDNDCDGVPSEIDCDDFDAAVGDGSDDADCDGVADDVERACGSDPEQFFSRPADLDLDGTCDPLDDDVDGDGAAADVDCDDREPTTTPGGPELPLDGIDNNCDGDFGADVFIDPALATGGGLRDFDTDGTRHYVSRGTHVDVFTGAFPTLTLVDSLNVGRRTDSIAVTGAFLAVEHDSAAGNTISVFDKTTLALVSSFVIGGDVDLNDRGGLFDDGCAFELSLDEEGVLAVSVTPPPAASNVCARTANGKYVAVNFDGAFVATDDIGPSAPLPLIGDAARDIVTVGDIAYVLYGNALHAVDVGGAAPVLRDTLQEEQAVVVGGVEAAVVFADRLALFNFGGSLQLIDISDPSALALVATPNADGDDVIFANEEIALFGPRFRTGEIFQGVFSADDVVFTRAAVVENNDVGAIHLRDGRAYVYAGLSFATQLSVFELDELGGRLNGDALAGFPAMEQPQTLDEQANLLGVNPFGDPAYVLVFDGDDTPGFISLPGGSSFGFAIDITVSPTRVVSIKDDFDGNKLDTWSHDGATATFLGSTTTQLALGSITLVGDVLVAAVDGEILAFPNATPTDLGAPLNIATIGTPRLVMARGNELFHATSEGFFGRRDVSNLNAPGAVTGDDTCVSGFVSGLTLDGDRAFVAGDSCVSFFDISGGGVVNVADRATPGFVSGAASAEADLISVVAGGVAHVFVDARE